MTSPSTPLFDRLISRQRPAWVTLSSALTTSLTKGHWTLGVSLLLALVPIVAAYLDGVLGAAFSQGYWRVLLVSPVVVIYILVVSPILARMDDAALQAFRPLVPLDDDRFNRLVSEASRVNPIGEAIAFGGGVL